MKDVVLCHTGSDFRLLTRMLPAQNSRVLVKALMMDPGLRRGLSRSPRSPRPRRCKREASSLRHRHLVRATAIDRHVASQLSAAHRVRDAPDGSGSCKEWCSEKMTGDGRFCAASERRTKSRYTVRGRGIPHCRFAWGPYRFTYYGTPDTCV